MNHSVNPPPPADESSIPDDTPADRPLFTLEELWVIGYLVLLALCIRSSIVAPYQVPTPSMEPTIMVGDRIIANKLAYGFRIPFLDYKLINWGEIKRGEIIVFTFPKNPELDFVKRVVAVGGDTVQISDDQLYLNGKPVPRSPPLTNREILINAKDHSSDKQLFVEDMDDHSFFITQTMPTDTVRNRHWPLSRRPYTVPDDAVFVMGDNRDNSSDSREWWHVPMANVKGKAQFVLWSAKGFGDIHWNRMFKNLYHQPCDPTLFSSSPQLTHFYSQLKSC